MSPRRFTMCVRQFSVVSRRNFAWYARDSWAPWHRNRSLHCDTYRRGVHLGIIRTWHEQIFSSKFSAANPFLSEAGLGCESPSSLPLEAKSSTRIHCRYSEAGKRLSSRTLVLVDSASSSQFFTAFIDDVRGKTVFVTTLIREADSLVNSVAVLEGRLATGCRSSQAGLNPDVSVLGTPSCHLGACKVSVCCLTVVK